MSELSPTDPQPVEPVAQPVPYYPPAPAEPGFAPAAPPPIPTRDSGMRLIAAVVAAVVLATGGGIGIGWNLARLITDRSAAHAQIHTVTPQTPAANGSTGSQAAAAKVIPAVVDINTVIQTVNSSAQAAGTGLILDSTGDVLTNNHVVQGSISIKVGIEGRSGSYTATVVGVAPSSDIAVIHIDGVSGLPTVSMADSSHLAVGDTVYAIGNALGLGGTPRVTQGQITALDQTITASEGGSNTETLTGMIQSDAEISPGDSGGALANGAGQVVGIITAGQATSFRTQTSSVGFAIPSSTAVEIANRILNGEAGNGILIGPVGFLGVSVETLDASSAAQLGLNITSGALVRGVQSGSPAQAAGITAGAVITAVNSTQIDSSNALGNALHQFKPGAMVKITWNLQGTVHSATVTLIAGPAV
jgi:S1-C subfamily serine protease